jgi:hypothetical protein
MRLQGWIMMLVGMMIFMTLFGIAPSEVSEVLGKIGLEVSETDIDTEDVEFFYFWLYVIGTLGGIGIAGAAIGLFARGYDPSLVYAPICVVIAGIFISFFWATIVMVRELNVWWMSGIVYLIFGTLLVGFMMAILDYFGGR